MPLAHLTDQSAAASRSRVECIREGLEGPAIARAAWVAAAKARIDELEFHGALFGLELFESDELRDLRALIADVTISASS